MSQQPEQKTAEELRLFNEIKTKIAKYYGFSGDWDRLVSEWERKVRDGMTGLPNIYIDKALEYATASLQKQLEEQNKRYDDAIERNIDKRERIAQLEEVLKHLLNLPLPEYARREIKQALNPTR